MENKKISYLKTLSSFLNLRGKINKKRSIEHARAAYQEYRQNPDTVALCLYNDHKFGEGRCDCCNIKRPCKAYIKDVQFPTDIKKMKVAVDNMIDAIERDLEDANLS